MVNFIHRMWNHENREESKVIFNNFFLNNIKIKQIKKKELIESE